MRSVPGLAAALALMLLSAAAHSASVTGALVEPGTKAPLAAVEVVLRRAADSTVVAHTLTGADGRFRLDSLRASHYLLRASRLGYTSWLRDVVLTESAPALDLGTRALAVSPIAVKGVETRTERATAIVAPDRDIYLTKDMPAASAGTTIDLLRSVPELQVDIDDKISLRGSPSVTIQINGRTSPLQGDALTAFLRQLPATRIERVEVIANPSAKFDPEGTAGIVNLVTKDPLDLGLSGSVFLMWGQRGRGGGPRIAWQKGRLTLYGGVNGYWGTWQSRYDDSRRNLLARPPSAYRLTSSSENVSGFGYGDGSFDYAFDQRSTLYGTANGSLGSADTPGARGYLLSDSTGITSSYDQFLGGTSDQRWGSGTLGFRHVVEQSRNEWTLELRQSVAPSGSSSEAVQHLLAPVDSAGAAWVLDRDDGSRERSLQLDDVHPLGAKGKLESGYRGAERRNTSSSALNVLSGPAGGGASAYAFREIFHSGYLTAGSTWGRLSLQAGLRAEAASTAFDAISRATRYDSDYRSVFPSANLAWDFGRGRTVRLAYSKRIERPSAGYLNPDVPSLDPLNRIAGNPYLAPKYTHSVSLEASWTGSRGLLRLSPYLRETAHNWDQFRTVDSLGIATTTWLNASSVRFLGASLVASLRQTGRFGGTANLSVYRERHDAGNVSTLGSRDAVNWSADGNATFKVTQAFSVQGWFRYTPAQTLVQGRMSAMLYSNLGARLKLGEKAWASLFASDPFGLWKYTFEMSDPTFVQTSTNRGSMRRVQLVVGASWGKPPEPKPRRQTDEPPPTQDPSAQVH